MKASGAVILLLARAALCQANIEPNVACAYNVTATACNLCTSFYEDGELREDWARCGGDCERIEENGGVFCHPAQGGVNCGERRESSCARCPIYQTEEGGVGHNMDLCQGDCQVKLNSRYPYCSSRDDEITTATTTTATTTTATTTPRTFTPSFSLLKEVSVNIVNTGRYSRPPRVQFRAHVCVHSNCCQTSPMNKRNGIYKFSTHFGNLGNCTDFPIGQYDVVRVKAVKTSSGYTPLSVMSITTQLYGGRQFIAEDVRAGWSTWSDPVITPLSWGRFSTTRSSYNGDNEPTVNLPDPHCPSPTDHICPLNNVHVHERLPDARKFCFYQECDLFTADLSTIENGDLGTGGYCIHKNREYPQYKYCCDLEQYFTHPDGTEKQGINFPPCNTMNYTRTD